MSQGIYVPRNVTLAQRQFELAASKGLGSGFNGLGVLHWSGEGMPTGTNLTVRLDPGWGCPQRSQRRTSQRTHQYAHSFKSVPQQPESPWCPHPKQHVQSETVGGASPPVFVFRQARCASHTHGRGDHERLARSRRVVSAQTGRCGQSALCGNLAQPKSSCGVTRTCLHACMRLAPACMHVTGF